MLLNEAQLALLNRFSDEQDAVPLRSLAFSFSLSMSEYGKDVRFSAPANPQPEEALGGALLGLLMSSAAPAPATVTS